MNQERLELNYEMSLCEELVSINREIKELQELQKKLQAEIKNLRPDGGKKYGISMTEKSRKGAVNMDLLCVNYDISEFELEGFRKPDVKFWEFRNY